MNASDSGAEHGCDGSGLPSADSMRMGLRRDLWAAVSLRIAKELQEFRKGWFEDCVGEVRRSSEKDESEADCLIIKHTELSGEALHACRAFQLYLISGYLAQHSYIPPSQGREFADLLSAHVCATELDKCDVFLRRYAEDGIDGGTTVFRFSADVARYITGKDEPLWESLVIGASVPLFGTITHIIVAEAFGDYATAARLADDLIKKSSGG